MKLKNIFKKTKKRKTGGIPKTQNKKQVKPSKNISKKKTKKQSK